MNAPSGSYVKLSETFYFGIHPQIVKPLGIVKIDHYVSLVEDHEVPDKAGRVAVYHEFPVKDRGAPSIAYLTKIVEFILSLEGVVYLFCKGGHGRSGTVAASVYGKMHRLSGKEAMAHINNEWKAQRDMRYIRPKIIRLGSPQTAIQKRTVTQFLTLSTVV
jgi:hypothetical protein